MAFKISVMCVACALLCLNIRSVRPEIALAVSLAAGAVALCLMLDEIGGVVKAIRELMSDSMIKDDDAVLIMKAAGIAVAGEYASGLYRDAGENALSQRVDMAVKVSLAALSAPLALRVIRTLSEIGV